MRIVLALILVGAAILIGNAVRGKSGATLTGGASSTTTTTAPTAATATTAPPGVTPYQLQTLEQTVKFGCAQVGAVQVEIQQGEVTGQPGSSMARIADIATAGAGLSGNAADFYLLIEADALKLSQAFGQLSPATTTPFQDDLSAVGADCRADGFSTGDL